MKVLNLLYNPITKEYGINNSRQDFFTPNTFIFEINSGPPIKRIKDYLKQQKSLNKKILLNLPEQTPELNTLATLIKKINPKAQIRQETPIKD